MTEEEFVVFEQKLEKPKRKTKKTQIFPFLYSFSINNTTKVDHIGKVENHSITEEIVAKM